MNGNNMYIWTIEDTARARDLFERGPCPCCSSPLFGWTHQDGTEYEPIPIAEGVMICGRCVGNKHCDPEHDDAGRQTLEFLLNAVANG